MKVLLVSPPDSYLTKNSLPPLGLGYIAAVLENANHQVKIFDAPIVGWNVNKTIDEIKENKPDILGITATTHSRFNAIKIIKGTHDLKCLKVLGGVHFSQTDKNALDLIPADIVVRGEGEYTMLEIAEGKNLKDIKGITYRQNQIIIRNPDRPFLELKELPFPARNLLPINDYKYRIEGISENKCHGILTSRGCPYQCVFCASKAFWNQRFRKRDPVNVVDEIEMMVDEYNIKGFDFLDDTFTIDAQHVTEVCHEIITRKLNIFWYARIRVNTVDSSILKLMKKSGCVAVSFGVESGSPRILKIIKKNIDLENVIKLCDLCSNLGLHIKVFFMFNHPGETIEDIKKTLGLIKQLKKYKNLTPVTAFSAIYPGTELENIAIEEGLISKDFSWNSPYFSMKNEIYRLNPEIPYYENIQFEKLIKLISTKNIFVLIKK